MPIRFVGCTVTQIKHQAYRKKTGATEGPAEEDRVKITVVKDCKRINAENEQLENEEDNAEVITDEEEKEETEPSMAVLMENFRRYVKES